MPSPIADALYFGARRHKKKRKVSDDLAIKNEQAVGDLLERARGTVEGMGFELDWIARNSESFYYRLPPHDILLRLSLHGRGKKRTGNAHPRAHLVRASVSFAPGLHAKRPGQTRMSDLAFTDHLARAIGRYMMAAADEPPTE